MDDRAVTSQWTEGDLGRSQRPWLGELLAAPGPLGFGLALAIVSPLTFTSAGLPWLGLMVLAGAGLYWWALMWVGGRVRMPSAWAILPAVLLLILLLAWPMWHGGEKFFSAPAVIPYAARSAGWSALSLGRETALLGSQKLVVVLLLAMPLYHAVHAGRWANWWFRLATMSGLGGLLLMAGLQASLAGSAGGPAGRAGLSAVIPVAPGHAGAILSAGLCWLGGLVLSSARKWRARLAEQERDRWVDAFHGPTAMLTVISGVLLVLAAGVTAMLLLGPMPWRQAAPWAGLASGLMLMLLGPPGRPWLWWSGAALLAGGVLAVWSTWPAGLARECLVRGGMFGSGQWTPITDDYSGLLWVLHSRGAAGLVLLAAALTLAGAWQWASWRKNVESPDRPATGAALVASWLIVAGWLIGPGHVTGPAALLAMTFWAMSLGPMPAQSYRGPGGHLVILAAVVIACYGLFGLTNMAHERMWLALEDVPHADKVLHAVWGLYVTLVCCLALAPLGRWPAGVIGLSASGGLAVVAEYIQKWYLPNRQFEWQDVVAYAAAAALVSVGLLLAPHRWRQWLTDRR